MTDPTRDGRIRVLPEELSGDSLELDTERDSGNWRGALPARVGDGPNAKTLDPEASQLDPEISRNIRTAALASIQDIPAEIVVVGPTVTPASPLPPPRKPTGWTTDQTPLVPSRAEGVRVSAETLPASASVQGRMVRPVSGSKSTIRPVGLTGEVVKAPYELAQEEKKRRLLFIAIGVVGGLGLGIIVLVVIGVL